MWKVYYDKKGKKLGEAWSVMMCRNMEDHKPHSHDPEFACFGPYMCAGMPTLALYDTLPRKPVNKGS